MTKACNILVTSAGRRVELIKCFQASLAAMKIGGHVFAADMVPELSSACTVAHRAFSVPSVLHDGYIDRLIELCSGNGVGLLIPTIDTELLLLAENADKFREVGVEVVVSKAGLIRSCRDKRVTGQLFESHDINYPEIYPKDSLHFPCFCKPYDGSRSVGAKAIFSPSDLSQDLLDNPKNIFMQLIPDSYCEYTVDGYYDSHGKLCSLVCRERVEVRSGEVSKGVSRKDFVYDFLVPRLSRLDGAKGCITFQFFVDKRSREIIGLEINPRFGGGYPLTHEVGAKFTDYLVKEYFLGHHLPFFDGWENDILMLRYDAAVYQKHV